MSPSSAQQVTTPLGIAAQDLETTETTGLPSVIRVIGWDAGVDQSGFPFCMFTEAWHYEHIQALINIANCSTWGAALDVTTPPWLSEIVSRYGAELEHDLSPGSAFRIRQLGISREQVEERIGAPETVEFLRRQFHEDILSTIQPYCEMGLRMSDGVEVYWPLDLEGLLEALRNKGYRLEHMSLWADLENVLEQLGEC